jgi:hypothetical protein
MYSKSNTHPTGIAKRSSIRRLQLTPPTFARKRRLLARILHHQAQACIASAFRARDDELK